MYVAKADGVIDLLWATKKDGKSFEAFLGALPGALFFIFTFGWCASTLVEGELRAVKVGLVVFGLPTLALFILTGILVGRKERTSSGV
jgi:hypothetical protein